MNIAQSRITILGLVNCVILIDTMSDYKRRDFDQSLAGDNKSFSSGYLIKI